MNKFQREFSKIKRSILIRDKWRCMFPSTKIPHGGPLTIDHIYRRSLGGDNDKLNLITLCVCHHNVVEAMRQEEKLKILHSILHKRYGYSYV